MSFGFSVGDFIAVGTLVADIISCFGESGGSKSEYQELLRELESLQHALAHLDKLRLGDSSLANIDSIKYAALSCRRPLEHFLGRIKKYDKTLGVWSKDGRLKGAAHKLGWMYGQKDEIRKLQSYLNVHVGTINILLAEHGLEIMSLASERVEADHMHIRERLDDTRAIINWIKDNVSAQALAVKFTNSMLSSLFDMITGEFRTTLKTLEAMVARVCVSTQQIYGIVLEIKSSLTLEDTRWAFFQAPLVVEDALGFKFPVPSEYDYELLDTIIKHRFLDGPGSLHVKVGNYELFKTKDSKQVLSASSRLLPGTSITMAILVGKQELADHTCPMPLCKSNRSTAVAGGGRLCCECNVWFDRSTKKRRSLQDLVDVIDQRGADLGLGKRKLDQDSAPRKRVKSGWTEEGSDSFKNVRWSMEGVTFEYPSESSQSQVPVDDYRNLLDGAIRFLNQVKVEFPDDPDTYNRFVDNLKDFEAKRLDTQGVIERAYELFVGREALLQGFNTFIRPGQWSIYSWSPPPPISWIEKRRKR